MPRNAEDPRRAALSLAEIWRHARLVWRLLTDPRVPWGPKLIIPGTLAYLISPIDLIPDILPGLGQLDDLAILLVGLKLFIEFCPRPVVQEHLEDMTYGTGTSRGQKRSTASTVEGSYRVVDDSMRP